MCLLSLGALLLDLAVGRDEGKRLGLGLDDGLCISAKDDDNVKVLNALMGLFERDLRADNDTGSRECLGLIGSDGDVEGFGG